MKNLMISLFILSFALFSGCTKESEESVQVAEDKVEQYKIDPDADEKLKQMCEKLSSAKEFSVRVQSSSDFITDTGEILKLHRNLDINLKRPDKLVVKILGDNGSKQLFYNGAEAILYHLNYGMYSIVKAPSTVDETLDLLADEYDLQIPASDFAYSDPYSYLMGEVKGAKYYGSSLINGVPCHHLYYIQDDIDWQIWIADNFTPRKFVINFKDDEDSPQFTSYLSDWNFSPSLPDEVFRFRPPDGTHEIEFMKVEKNSN
jgi:hypothetical protein